MAKVGAKKIIKDTEKKTYFNSTFGFKSVTKFAKGVTEYVLFLKPEENLYETMIHVVKQKKNPDRGFQGKFATNIKCKSYDADGTLVEGDKALCCELYEKEKDKFPSKEESGKRMVSYARPIYHIPVLVLGHNIKDPAVRSYPVGNAKITTGYKFAYMELSKSSWINIYNGLAKKLKEETIIDYNLDGEELQAAVYENLSKVVVQVEGVDPAEGSWAKYGTNYTFYPFVDTKIARATGEYDLITSWEKAKELVDLRNEATDFLTLLEQHEHELTVDWTEERLTKYVVEDEKRRDDISQYKKAVEQENTESQVITTKPQTENPPTTVNTSRTGVQAISSEIEYAEEDFTYEEEDDDFIYE